MSKLSHVDTGGRATMVDVSGKPVTDRSATAQAVLLCAAETLGAVRDGTTPKGAVISTAELAGIMAAKRTAELIPLCHPLPLNRVAVAIDIDDGLPGFRISATARTSGQTGVEMEALTAASVAALTLYDMLKAVDPAMEISAIRLVRKRGGKRDIG